MFYKFKQNNSGGWFDIDDDVTINVYIEAENKDQANELAQTHGIYFDGVRDGQDCRCCGDRWNEAQDFNGEETIESERYDNHWVKVGEPYAYVYYLDGRKEELIKKEANDAV